MDNEIITLSEAPITITRTFKLGDYKNLKVNITPSELDDNAKWQMMLENVFDAYMQLFAHQIVTAELYNGDTSLWEDKILKLIELKKKFQEE